MISGETLKVIKERPEFAEMLKYLSEEAVKLNSLSEIPELSYVELTPEILARKRAYQTLKRILEPLVDIPDLKPKSKLDDYSA